MKKSLKIFGLAALGVTMMFACSDDSTDSIINQAVDSVTSGCVITKFDGQSLPEQTSACTTPVTKSVCDGQEGDYKECPKGYFRECARTGNTIYFYYTGPQLGLPIVSAALTCPEGYEEKGGSPNPSSNSQGNNNSSSSQGGNNSSSSQGGGEVYGGCYWDASEEGFDFGSCFQPDTEEGCTSDGGVFMSDYCPENPAVTCEEGVYLYGDDAEESFCYGDEEP